jgi:hypothetical protein
MNNYKIKLNNEAESREAQDLFEQLGFKWSGDYPENGDWYSHIYAENSYCCYLSPYVWSGLADTFKELTLTQLRDLVVLHRNDVNDATHSCDGMNGAAININGSWYGYNYFKNEWQLWDEYEDDEYKIIDLKPIQPESEQVLISRADAKLAWAKGEDVQISHKHATLKKEWHDLYGTLMLSAFDSDMYEFRLKPRTITLNVEIPAPFEPKEKDIFWTLSTNYKCGYVQILCYRNDEQGERLAQFGAWRTEEEIKQVVAALRGGIKA